MVQVVPLPEPVMVYFTDRYMYTSQGLDILNIYIHYDRTEEMD